MRRRTAALGTFVDPIFGRFAVLLAGFPGTRAASHVTWHLTEPDGTTKAVKWRAPALNTVLLRYIKLSTVHYVGAGVCLVLAVVTAFVDYKAIPNAFDALSASGR